jgi:hypothetical protein
MSRTLILLLLVAAGQPAIAQEKSRGAAGYSSAPTPGRQ